MSRIAVNVMVKNARDTILDALISAEPFVDEMVVFDTGSSDDTQTVVQNFLSQRPNHIQCIYQEVPWVDDFSAIRNQMLDATTADWVLALDSDEVLTISGGTLRDLAQSGHKAFFIEKRSYVKTRDIEGFKPVMGEHPKQEKGYAGYLSEPNYLFFEKNPKVRYERCVHETIELSLVRAQIPSVRTNQVFIHNHGRHDMSAKGPWYSSLIKKLTAQSPDDGLAWCYQGVQEKEEGLLIQALASFDNSIHLIPDYAAPKLMKARCLLALGKIEDAQAILNELSRTHPNEEVIWIELIRSTAHNPNAAELINSHITRLEALKAETPEIYEAAAAILGKMKKQVKAEIFRKRARELRKRTRRN